MKILYTPTRFEPLDYQFSIIDTQTLEIQNYGHKIDINTNKYYGSEERHKINRPFGVSWNEQNLFVANRTNLIKFDKNLNQLNHYDIYHGNPHQILEIDGKVYASDTSINCINVFDIESEKVEILFDPVKQEEVKINGPVHYRDMDKDHINSLHYDGEFLYIILNNWGQRPSEFMKLDFNFNILQRKFFHAKRAHCVYIDSGLVSTLDTGISHYIVREDNSCVRIKTFAADFIRGYAGNKDFHIIGATNINNRQARLIFINKKTLEQTEINLDCKHFAELRLISEFDYSHNKESFL
tara:strand:+ start:143 stop:1030 length:888 start_codon:yes stop_codon:yes gene_type:complete